MGLFSFVIYKEYYYFLIYWCMDLVLYIPSLILKSRNSKPIESLVTYDYLHLLNLNIADLLSGFLVLITYYRMKPKKEIIETKNKVGNSNNSIELIYNDYSEKDNKYTLIFILSILELFARSSKLFFNLIDKYKDEQINEYDAEWIISIDIISRIIFSKIILKTRLYKHHIISVIIFLFGSIIMTIFGIIYMKTNFMIKLLFLIPRNIIFGLGDIISKILLTYKFVLPQKLIFIKGLFNLGMHLIIFPILWFTGKFNKDDFLKNFDSGIIIVYNIINIFFFFIRAFCIMNIIDKFSPLHVAFVNVVLCLYQYIILLSTPFDELNSYILIFINIICFIIIIFSTLLFNEIIIINAWGLNIHTKKDILLREKKDNLLDNSESRNSSMSSDGILNINENL